MGSEAGSSSWIDKQSTNPSSDFGSISARAVDRDASKSISWDLPTQANLFSDQIPAVSYSGQVNQLATYSSRMPNWASWLSSSEG